MIDDCDIRVSAVLQCSNDRCASDCASSMLTGGMYVCMYVCMWQHYADLGVNHRHSGDQNHMPGGGRQSTHPIKHHVPTLRVYDLAATRSNQCFWTDVDASSADNNAMAKQQRFYRGSGCKHMCLLCCKFQSKCTSGQWQRSQQKLAC